MPSPIKAKNPPTKIMLEAVLNTKFIVLIIVGFLILNLCGVSAAATITTLLAVAILFLSEDRRPLRNNLREISFHHIDIQLE